MIGRVKLLHRSRILLKANSSRIVASGGDRTVLPVTPSRTNDVGCTEHRRWMSLILQRSPPLANAVSTIDDPCFGLGQLHQQQVRWRRYDRSTIPEKKPTKKQRKEHRRKILAARKEKEKHSPPGSKAAFRRQYVKAMKEDLMNPEKITDEELLEYDAGDALLDDLVGNSRRSQETPRPKYLGHLHHKLYTNVADQMDAYLAFQHGDTSQSGALMEHTPSLPSDVDVANVLRAYRDKHGTRRKPIGLVKALQHLLQDLHVPVSTFGEHTYTSLMTCCSTPAEGRRVMQMQRDNQHALTEYSWSILADIYAKVGDFEGCAQVIEEMAREGGHVPTLSAYTSFLSACYRVCSDGRVPAAIRSRAFHMGWEKWQEMRTVGVDPDVMAYGAIIRLCATRSQAERTIDLLEEMERMGVQPTTLCFSSALRAVARSHATSIRYEHGSSRRNRRREYWTQHHGKMAISIVRLAEAADIEQDDGFIAALIGCAAAAGDVATAKAIYIASQIRRLDELRTIGSDTHLARLRGEGPADDIPKIALSSGNATGNEELRGGGKSLATKEKSLPKPSSFEEREYGKDSRVLSVLLHACAVAADENGMGTIWQGRENEGYFCENSLRLIAARRVPEYLDQHIPGQSRTDALKFDEHEDKASRKKVKKGRQTKFTGDWIDEDVASNVDELDEPFASLYVNPEDGRLRKEYRSTTPADIWRMKYGDEKRDNEDDDPPLLEGDMDEENLLEARYSGSSEDEYQIQSGHSRDVDSNFIRLDSNESSIGQIRQEDSRLSARNKKIDRPIHSGGKGNTDEYNHGQQTNIAESEDDYNSSSWTAQISKTSTTIDQMKNRNFGEENRFSQFENDVLKQKSNNIAVKEFTDDDEKAFEAFHAELLKEAAESGLHDVSYEEAREMFWLMKDEFNDFSDDGTDLPASARMRIDDPENDGHVRGDVINKIDSHAHSRARDVKTVDMMHGQESRQISSNPDQTIQQPLPSGSPKFTRTMEVDPSFWSPEEAQNEVEAAITPRIEGSVADVEEVVNDDISVSDYELKYLREALPSFSRKRLKKILNVFQTNLGDPSILELIPLVRERMPDYLTATWLKQMSLATSRFVLSTASQNGLVDIHMVNGVLEMEAACGSLDRAVEVYETSFRENGLEPNEYSDRLVLQMFLRNNRFSRALSLKSKLHTKGRLLDIPAYGSLVDYCARRGQLGTALLILRECVTVHGAPPSEACVSQLRILCRQADITDEVRLNDLVGEDPAQWLRYGEANLKREYSRRGRNVKHARDKLVHI